MTFLKPIARGVALAIAVLMMVSCGALSPTSPSSKVKTYPAVSIYAYWSGGAAGAPSNGTFEVSNAMSGTYCPDGSLVLDNHGTRYQGVFSNSRQVLVFKNLCSEPANLLVCVSAGSGGNFSEFPICNVSPRTTPASRLASVTMGPNNSGLASTTWRETGLGLSLQVYYCAVGDTFSLGAVPGADPTECIVH